VVVLSACGTTSKTTQPHAIPQPASLVIPHETSMLPDSEVQPSRFSMLFDSLEVPLATVESKASPSGALLEQLQQAVIQKIRNAQLFAGVVPKAKSHQRGILTLTTTILSWDEHTEEGTIGIRLGIVDTGSSCELTYATTTGTLKRMGHANIGVSTGPYEIQPLVDGTAAFVSGFMRPKLLEL